MGGGGGRLGRKGGRWRGATCHGRCKQTKQHDTRTCAPAGDAPASAPSPEPRLGTQRAGTPYGPEGMRPARGRMGATRAVAGGARDGADGDLACYRVRLAGDDRAVARKAAYMIAWTVRDDDAARGALLERADTPDPQQRRSILIALDSRAPNGCAACVTRLEAIHEAEQGQESRALMNLEIELLLARLRARAR